MCLRNLSGKAVSSLLTSHYSTVHVNYIYPLIFNLNQSFLLKLQSNAALLVSFKIWKWYSNVRHYSSNRFESTRVFLPTLHSLLSTSSCSVFTSCITAVEKLRNREKESSCWINSNTSLFLKTLRCLSKWFQNIERNSSKLISYSKLYCLDKCSDWPVVNALTFFELFLKSFCFPNEFCIRNLCVLNIDI